jgi:hypothetical protein
MVLKSVVKLLIEFPDLNYFAGLRAARDMKQNGYSKDFVRKICKESGISALTQAKQLVSGLENLGLNRSLIEQAGTNLGLSGLLELKGLLRSGMPETEIVSLLSQRINIITNYFDSPLIKQVPSLRINLLNKMTNDSLFKYVYAALFSSLIILSLAMTIRLQAIQADYFIKSDYFLFLPQSRNIILPMVVIFLTLLSVTAVLLTLDYLRKNINNKVSTALIKKCFCLEFIAILVLSMFYIPMWFYMFHNYIYIMENGIGCRNDYFSSEEIFTWNDVDKVEARAYMKKSLGDERLELSYIINLKNGKRYDLWHAKDSYKSIDKIDEINKIMISQNIHFNITPVDIKTLQEIDSRFIGDELDQVKRIFHI